MSADKKKAPVRANVKANAPTATRANAPTATRANASAAAQEEKFSRLRRFNGIMGVLHLIQGLFMWIVSNDTSYPVYSNFLGFNTETFSLSPVPKIFMELRFGPAVAIFLLLSAAAHFYLATFGYERYTRNLRKNMNPVRFYEYALSSSVMIVLIGMLSGIFDLGAVILIFFLNASMNLFGIMMEYHNQNLKKTNWTGFIYGSVAGIIPWVVIFIYFIGSVNSGDAKPPTFVYAIIPTLFVFFNIFAINMVLQYKKVGKWKDYLFGERFYIILSLAAKTVLAWIIFAGTLAPV